METLLTWVHIHNLDRPEKFKVSYGTKGDWDVYKPGYINVTIDALSRQGVCTMESNALVSQSQVNWTALLHVIE